MRHLVYLGAINERGCRNTMILLSEALRDGDEKVALHLASRGGDVMAGMGLYNFIKMLSLTIHTHALGVCESIAATVLLAGTERSCAPAGQITLHAPTYSEGPMMGQPANTRDLIAQPFRDLGWSGEDIADRFAVNNDFVMTPERACELRVIHTISDLTINASDTVISIAVD